VPRLPFVGVWLNASKSETMLAIGVRSDRRAGLISEEKKGGSIEGAESPERAPQVRKLRVGGYSIDDGFTDELCKGHRLIAFS